jgi:type I restriction enzyme R subunit
VVCGIGGAVVCADLFDHPETLRRLYPSLVRSYALEALGISKGEMGLLRCPGDQRQRSEGAWRATLRTIAQELVRTVRANVTVVWTVRENVRAQLRVVVKRILRKYGYSPDKQEKATLTVLEQAKVLSELWAAA